MAGLENIIGTGSAQILPRPASMMPLVDQLQQNRQQKFIRDKYEQSQKEQDEKQLYGLVGDALNLRDFNPVIHDRVRQAQVELAQKLKSEKPSYGDAYIAAQNKAGELGILSQSLNQADQIIAAQKKEWEGDKRINAAALEGLARKDILEDLQKNGKIDINVNYMNRALRRYPKYALTDNGEFAQHKFLPEEMQKGLFGKYKATNKRGGVDQFDWKVGDLAPAFYDFKDNGENAAPTITTKSEDSPYIDNATKKAIPMLSEDAWGRYSAVTSNVVDLDRRIDKKYNGTIDLESQEAETLRRIEAYKEVEKMMPKISKSVAPKENPAPRITINTGGGSSAKTEKAQAVADANNWLSNTQSAINNKDINAINSQFQILERGGRFVDINASYDKGGNIVVKYSTPNTDGDFKEISRTFKNDANLQNQLKGLYQSLTGEDKVFEYSNPATNNTGSSYKVGGKTFTKEQLEKGAKKNNMSFEQYLKSIGAN